ncbi:MAG: rod shape-determining protein MreD [Coriobacteriales bacterium]|nr:rod shape-determining protein MreD [Coriobacteriales bacterium]MBQ6586435.1 rod shape-determining protein MreD [Coriobacteriales bacterium]
MEDTDLRFYLIVCVICLLLQLMVAPNIAINGIVPNILFVPVTLAGFLYDSRWGCTVGFIAGLLLDLLGVGPLGGMALICSIMGFACSLLPRSIFSESWLSPVGWFALCALGANLVYGLLLLIMGEASSLGGILLYRIIPNTLYDSAFAFLVYPFVYWQLSQNKPRIRAGHRASRRKSSGKKLK